MEPEQFDQIYQEYFDPVYRYVLSLSGDTHVAEEVTQETFFKALRSLDRFRGESSVKTINNGIVKNNVDIMKYNLLIYVLRHIKVMQRYKKITNCTFFRTFAKNNEND